MLNINDVLSLRDLALSHLPQVQKQSEIAYTEGRSSRAALQVVAAAPAGVATSPLSTSVERQAARLLHLIGKHPETHTEWLSDDVDGDDFPGELTDILKADAERDRDMIGQSLMAAARELCRLSGAALPPWMVAEIIASTESTPPGESAKSSGEIEITPADRRKALDITRYRGAPRRILEQWGDIEKLHGSYPDGRQVWRILSRDKTEGEVSLKSVQNSLPLLRKAGLIP